MFQLGLIGYPLNHSFSPAYFADKFKRENISGWSYQPYPLHSIDELLPLIETYPGLRGLNVTIPYKKEVLRFLWNKNDAVRETNACNCIKIKDRKLLGYNTDVLGFERSFSPLLKAYHKKALILGTGGAASAVVYVLNKLGIAYQQVSRTKKENTLSYDELSNDALQDHLVIINTTPVGMYPEVNDCPALPYSLLTPQHLLYDLIYNPQETLFLKKGKEQGAIIKNGMEMLQIQAEESWRIWTTD